MKLTLENGAVIEGDLDELKEFLDGYEIEKDTRPRYYSESKGQYILIETMNDEHIKNAILKLMHSYLNDMKGASNESFGEMYNKLVFGFEDDDVYKELDYLVEELDTRAEENVD